MRKYLILIVLLVGFLIYFTVSNLPPQINFESVKASSVIDYVSEDNFRQTGNDCGPYNVAAVVRAVTGEEVSSAEFAEDIGWRLPNDYTLPWGLESQLKNHGVAVETPNVSGFSDKNKISFLKERLSNNHPLIILGERDNYEHYITLFGFDGDEFYAYDSLYTEDENGLTIDANGELPGNRTYSKDELIEFWSGGGMYGLYNWFVIVAS